MKQNKVKLAESEDNEVDEPLGRFIHCDGKNKKYKKKVENNNEQNIFQKVESFIEEDYINGKKDTYYGCLKSFCEKNNLKRKKLYDLNVKNNDVDGNIDYHDDNNKKNDEDNNENKCRDEEMVSDKANKINGDDKDEINELKISLEINGMEEKYIKKQNEVNSNSNEKALRNHAENNNDSVEYLYDSVAPTYYNRKNKHSSTEINTNTLNLPMNVNEVIKTNDFDDYNCEQNCDFKIPSKILNRKINIGEKDGTYKTGDYNELYDLYDKVSPENINYLKILENASNMKYNKNNESLCEKNAKIIKRNKIESIDRYTNKVILDKRKFNENNNNNSLKNSLLNKNIYDIKRSFENESDILLGKINAKSVKKPSNKKLYISCYLGRRDTIEKDKRVKKMSEKNGKHVQQNSLIARKMCNKSMRKTINNISCKLHPPNCYIINNITFIDKNANIFTKNSPLENSDINTGYWFIGYPSDHFPALQIGL